jgi:hypothetical protein
MPAIVFTAPYVDRSARVACAECGLDVERDRTADAQDLARRHNIEEHPETVPEERA